MTAEREPGGVQSAEVALHILRILAEGGGDMPLSRLAGLAGVPPAKAHRYVISLIRAGFVEQASRHGNYSLGAQALKVGLVALGRLDIMEVASTSVAQVRDELDQTIMLAVWGDNGPVVIRWCESNHPVTVNVRIGSIMSLCQSATGQVFGAWAPAALVEPVLTAELAATSRRGARAALTEARATFDKVRAEGRAAISGVLLPGVQAISVPVFNANGQIEAALTALGTAGSFDMSPEGRVSVVLRDAALRLSERIGFNPS